MPNFRPFDRFQSDSLLEILEAAIPRLERPVSLLLEYVSTLVGTTPTTLRVIGLLAAAYLREGRNAEAADALLQTDEEIFVEAARSISETVTFHEG